MTAKSNEDSTKFDTATVTVTDHFNGFTQGITLTATDLDAAVAETAFTEPDASSVTLGTATDVGFGSTDIDGLVDAEVTYAPTNANVDTVTAVCGNQSGSGTSTNPNATLINDFKATIVPAFNKGTGAFSFTLSDSGTAWTALKGGFGLPNTGDIAVVTIPVSLVATYYSQLT